MRAHTNLAFAVGFAIIGVFAAGCDKSDTLTGPASTPTPTATPLSPTATPTTMPATPTATPIPMPGDSSISGTVRGGGGGPYTVSIAGPSFASSMAADSDGRYEFVNVPPGTYVLTAHTSVSGYERSTRQVSVPPDLYVVDFLLQPSQ